MTTRTYILYIILAAILSACSSETTLEGVEDISGSTDPMRFTIVRESEVQTPGTRASQPLTSGFMVSCYKHYGTTQQQTVMPKYEVQYFTTGTAWDGTVRPYWQYDQVNGQFLRYWDLSAYPYRFHALAPYPANTTNFDLSDTKLTIPAAYSAQTCINGMVTPANDVAEPYLLAQVQRNTDGTDHDLLRHSTEQTEINNGSANKVRDVWMPFHHLNSKIRFGVYHTTQWLTANKTYIQGMTINVTSPQFVTAATSYADDTNQQHPWYLGTGNAGFKGLTKVPSSTSAGYQIFRFDGGAEVEDNDLREKQTRQTAYFMQCPGGIMQLPQENVQMTVSFDLMREDGTLYQRFHNVPVRLELGTAPVTYDYDFDWRQDYLYTYYLVIGEIEDKLEITFTATLAPWEDVTGSLSTDLEK